jgi:hypothetical protein
MPSDSFKIIALKGGANYISYFQVNYGSGRSSVRCEVRLTLTDEESGFTQELVREMDLAAETFAAPGRAAVWVEPVGNVLIETASFGAAEGLCRIECARQPHDRKKFDGLDLEKALPRYAEAGWAVDVATDKPVG